MKTKELAARFLEIADQMNEAVSRYIDGSNAAEDENAYWMVREADRAFIDAIREEYGEKYEYGLNYELAESFV
jgi:hypothetical protein